MSLRIATFNVENLMNRFDFSGYRNELRQDRSVKLYNIRSEAEYRLIEQARTIAHTDDTRQLTALAIAETGADILCMQEVDNLDALKAFEYGYLFKMIGRGYRYKYMVEGNDGRGIDVALMMREQTRDGQEIEFVNMQSHAGITYADFDLFDDAIAETNEPGDQVFRRDCLEIDVRIGGRPLTILVGHFKSMGSPRNGMDGRTATMAVRSAEARAVRKIIENRFGAEKAAAKRWVICGDMNDYQERIVITGDRFNGFAFEHVSGKTGARSTSSPATALPKMSSCAARRTTAGPSITRAGRTSGTCASSTTCCCRRRSPNTTPSGCPTSFAAASHSGRSFRRDTMRNVIPVPDGTDRRPPITAPSP